jgi:hypothetical protein
MPRRLKLGGETICPPGFFCMDLSTMIFLIMLALSILVFFLYIQNPEKTTTPQVVVLQTPNPTKTDNIFNSDPRFAPLPPEQSYNTPPIPAGLGAISVNTYTRGAPGAFQQVGVLTAPGGSETSGSPNRTILPLFGRSIDSNRNRWNYYTRSDGINPVQLPIQYKRRDCDDDNGCDELNDGDSVGVPILGGAYTVSLYRYSTPRYIP